MTTHDFLVELGTEELPPKALKKLSHAFTNGILSRLDTAQITYNTYQSFASPRRLSLLIKGLNTAQPDQQLERKGPRLGAPKQAIEGFALSNDVSLNELETLKTPKGEWLVYRSTKKGEKTASLLPKIISHSLASLPIPKRMRWGSNRDEFVRPVHWLLMLLDNYVIDCEILGVKAGNKSYGHRFHANEAIPIKNPLDYQDILEKKGYVIADFNTRRNIIKSQIMAEAEKINGHAIVSDDLLDEVTALVEWPVALSGSFDSVFLSIPAESLISSMKEHQKYFHIVDADGILKANFITISNIKSKDQKKVIKGNERVIRPRLSDAKFFFETDKQTSLEEKRIKLKDIIFQSKLGSIFDKTERISKLSSWIASQEGSNKYKAEKAGKLSKSDLVSEMVLEFPDLQGIMGQYYAAHDGEDEEVCKAINEQYMPRFSGDNLPSTLTGSALAIADKIDTLTGIFGIGQLPTGSKDPFALRRASIGILRIIIEKKLNLDLEELILQSIKYYDHESIELPKHKELKKTLVVYMVERLYSLYQEDGIKAEIINSIKALNLTQPLDIDSRIKAVCRFCKITESSALAEANKRVSNIMIKATNIIIPDVIDKTLLKEKEEIDLNNALNSKRKEVEPLLKQGHYAMVMESLVTLKEPVDLFFDKVLVNAEDDTIKLNRYALLKQLRNLFLQIADISLLQKS